MVRIETIVQLITYLCVALGFASVCRHLHSYHMAAFLCLALFSLYFEHRRVVRIPRWLLNTISLGILSLAVIRITPEYLIEPILDALIILVAIKLMEEKKTRDYMQIYTICMFLLIGSTLISLSISFLLYLSLLLTLVTAALILLAYWSHNPEMVISKKNLAKVMHQSLWIFALSIPLSAVLFLILPRTAYPFLTFLTKAGYARSGFTDTIALGEVTAIQEDNAVIFRAETERIEDSKLYWRGVVLDQFDGSKWTSSSDMDKEERMDAEENHTAVQTIYLEPYGNKYLFALDKPISFSVYRNKYSRTRILPFKTRIYERIRYTATSVIAAAFPQATVDRKRYLQLPENTSPRVKGLVDGLIESKSQEEQMKTLFAFIQRGNYEYSLENLSVSEDPLEDFLFSNKRGNCEYFASSLAVMLRMAGIPARLVGGYKGGAYNGTGKYYLVTQRNAHVWVEANLHGIGWLRLDPTPPIPEASWSRTGGRAILQLRLLLDTFNYYWYKIIIDYDFTRQLEIMNAVREWITRPELRPSIDTTFTRNHLMGVGLLITLCVFLYSLISKYQRPERRIISRFLDRMAAYGYEKKPHEGLEEFINRLDREDIKDRARIFVEDFEQLYYRDRLFTRETIRRLRTQIKRL